MIDIKQLKQDKAHLIELWEFLGLPGQMPDVSLWLLNYGADMIESAFKTIKKVINKGTVVKDVEKYLGKMLYAAKQAGMSPEEREAYVSLIRSTAGEVGARKKHANAVKAARAELAAALANSEKEDLPEVCQTLPEVCSLLPDDKGLRVEGEGLKGVGGTTVGSGTASPVDASTVASLSNPNLEPKTENPEPKATATSRDSVPHPDGDCLSPVPLRGLSSPSAKGKPRRRACKQHKQKFPDSFDSWSNLSRSTWCKDGHPATEGGLSILQQYDREERERPAAKRAAAVPAQPEAPVQVTKPEPVERTATVPDGIDYSTLCKCGDFANCECDFRRCKHCNALGEVDAVSWHEKRCEKRASVAVAQ